MNSKPPVTSYLIVIIYDSYNLLQLICSGIQVKKKTLDSKLIVYYS